MTILALPLLFSASFLTMKAGEEKGDLLGSMTLSRDCEPISPAGENSSLAPNLSTHPQSANPTFATAQPHLPPFALRDCTAQPQYTSFVLRDCPISVRGSRLPNLSDFATALSRKPQLRHRREPRLRHRTQLRLHPTQSTPESTEIRERRFVFLSSLTEVQSRREGNKLWG
ncbi:hypothetical protein Adt_07204 [Abeliophyllum distichum]|uniref:Uncharacterized protein n=1 Tax=Abeliophyllum distichum TaxID=126358 RepID=A0ABD1VB87_9LAMI